MWPPPRGSVVISVKVIPVNAFMLHLHNEMFVRSFQATKNRNSSESGASLASNRGYLDNALYRTSTAFAFRMIYGVALIVRPIEIDAGGMLALKLHNDLISIQ
jgi:hypothetical protein